MTITYHPEVIQGSEAWMEMRLGLLTASEMRLILTPTLKIADNDKTRSHIYELLAQRITKFVEPRYVSEEMLRGTEEEFYARQEYAERYAPVEQVGFITNDRWGFTIGYSPDGLVGDDGLIEIKSRRAKYQVQTIAEAEVPADFMMQLQTGLLVSEREWIDFVSYSGGLPMFTLRVHPMPEVQEAIIAAATAFEAKLADKHQAYLSTLAQKETRAVPTERRIELEMYA